MKTKIHFSSMNIICAVLLFIIGSACGYAKNDAVLTIIPAQNAKPGDSFQFSVAFTNITKYPIGDSIEISVAKIGGFAWDSDVKSIIVPEGGKPVKIDFEKMYMVPPDTDANTNICFRVMMSRGATEEKAPLSDAACMVYQSSPDKSASAKDTDKAEQGITPEDKPDLIIDYIAIDKSDPLKAKILVRNQGDKESAPCKLIIDLTRFNVEPYRGAFSVPRISPNKKKWIEISTAKPMGSACDCKMKVCVDSENEITESNENNNCLKKSYHSAVHI